jgi:hypothetical protein
MNTEIIRALAVMAPAEFERNMRVVNRIRAEVAASTVYQRQMDLAMRGIYSERLRGQELDLRLSYARCGFAGADIEDMIRKRVYD